MRAVVVTLAGAIDDLKVSFPASNPKDRTAAWGRMCEFGAKHRMSAKRRQPRMVERSGRAQSVAATARRPAARSSGCIAQARMNLAAHCA
jgi:hypothetical protein